MEDVLTVQTTVAFPVDITISIPSNVCEKLRNKDMTELEDVRSIIINQAWEILRNGGIDNNDIVIVSKNVPEINT